MTRLALLGVLLALLLAGCRGDYGSRCEDPGRYAGSPEVPPVRVPDDLSVPSENEALRIPPGGQLPEAEPRSGRGPCLESPPSYFENAPEAAGDPAQAQTGETGGVAR